ncbi:putative ribonuclease H-like domain-containing protein [Tanacetum coccineum]
MKARKKAIGTKWVFRNKRDERSIVVKNKARLVAQGFRQEEGIDYDKVFALVAKIEVIRLFLAFASFMRFPVYQMDVKSAFLYDTIEEEVYVHQPPGFVDPTHPNKVYKVIKALYGLHQAPRAWYETLSSFLLKNGFRRGTIDKTLFIKKNKSDIMLVQVYVDDIIFGSTTQSMCTEFEDCMHKRFQMSSMGELTFFLGLQVKQQPDGIFISQDKYVADILKKFDFCSIKIATTPIALNKPLVKDKDGVDVDVHIYRSMIGSLMYLTVSRPDIMFSVCACTEAFSDSDYRGASLDMKSTTGGCQFLGRRLISWQCKKQTIVVNSTTKAEYVVAANCRGQAKLVQPGIKVGAARQKFLLLVTVTTVGGHTRFSLINSNRPTIYTSYIDVKQIDTIVDSKAIVDSKIDTIVDSKAVVVTEASIRSSLLFNDADGPACLTNEAIFQNLALMGYEAEGEGSGEPTKPQPTPSPTQPSTGDQPPKTSPSHATTLDSRDSLEGTNRNEKDQVQTPHDSPLSGGHTSNRAKGALNLQELSILCTNLSNKVLASGSIKDAQAAEISALKSRIKKLEKKCKPSISHHRAWLKSVNRLSMKKKFRKKESVSKQGRKKSKPESTLDDSTVFDDQDADHGIEYMETEEAVDEGRQSGETKEVKLIDDAKFVEDNGSDDKGGNAEELVSTARPDIDAARQVDSAVDPRTPLTTTSIFDDEDITMAQTLIKMKEEKAKEKGVSIKDVDESSRPARSILTLKPLPTIDPKDKEVQAKMDASEELAARLQMEERDVHNRRKVDKKTFEEIQAIYIKEQERDTDFMPIGFERDEKMIDKMNKKTAGMDEEEVPEGPERTKVEVKQEGREENIMKRLEEQLRASLKIVPDEEEEINYEVLGTRFSTTTPEGIDLVLWGNLRIMFEETADDDIWKNKEKWIIKSWNFYENCGVHNLALEDGTKIHMLAERRYLLIRETLERMMELRLTAESEGEAVFDLLRFIQKQIDEFGGQDGSEKDL